jgi:hypothetical protein
VSGAVGSGVEWNCKGVGRTRNESAAIGQVKRLFPVELGECPGLDRLVLNWFRRGTRRGR